MSIQELIQRYFERGIICGGNPNGNNEDYDNGRVAGHREADNYTKELIKSLIDAVIEDEEKEIEKIKTSKPKTRLGDKEMNNEIGDTLSDIFTISYISSKQDTINKLKAIRDML